MLQHAKRFTPRGIELRLAPGLLLSLGSPGATSPPGVSAPNTGIAGPPVIWIALKGPSKRSNLDVGTMPPSCSNLASLSLVSPLGPANAEADSPRAAGGSLKGPRRRLA